MALDNYDRISVVETVKESLRLFWDLRVPYLVLVAMTTLPWAAAIVFGALDPLFAFGAMNLSELSGEEFMAAFPWGTILLFVLGSGATILCFLIFWFRYLLCGREDALKFGPADLIRIFARFLGGALAFGFGACVLMFIAIIAVAAVASSIASMVGLSEDASDLLNFGLGFLGGYVLPVLLLAKIALAFPAYARDDRFGLRASWSAMEGTTWRMLGSFMLVAIPCSILVQAVSYPVFLAFGIDIYGDASSAISKEHELISLALAPIAFLPLALCSAITAIAYQEMIIDGGGAEEPELADIESLVR